MGSPWHSFGECVEEGPFSARVLDGRHNNYLNSNVVQNALANAQLCSYRNRYLYSVCRLKLNQWFLNLYLTYPQFPNVWKNSSFRQLHHRPYIHAPDVRLVTSFACLICLLNIVVQYFIPVQCMSPFSFSYFVSTIVLKIATSYLQKWSTWLSLSSLSRNFLRPLLHIVTFKMHCTTRHKSHFQLETLYETGNHLHVGDFPRIGHSSITEQF